MGREYERAKVSEAALGEHVEQGWHVLFRYPDGDYQLRRVKQGGSQAQVIPVG